MGSIQENLIVKLILDYKKSLFFPKGIDKYASVNDFTLLAYDNQNPVFWMEGKIFKNLNFMLVDPYMVIPSYNPIIDAKYLDDLELSNIREGLILCIANRQNNPEMELTVNLVHPILINWSTGLADQVPIENSYDYSRDFPFNTKEIAPIIWS